MIKKIIFAKMAASGNDFVLIDNAGTGLAFVRNLYRDGAEAVPCNVCSLSVKKLCDRKYGVGADGVLLLEKSKKADIKMRIFNADGSEAEMCGNGARCAAFYSARRQKTEDRKQKKIDIETKAGIIKAVVEADNVKIKLTGPKDIKTGIPLKINNRSIKVNFVNTGVPHTVVFVEGLEKIDVFNFGRAIRYHNKFKPAGTNVDFVEVINKDSIRVRTYERGVEDETLACGTGSAASALLYAVRELIVDRLLRRSAARNDTFQVNVRTQGGEILKVYFDYSAGRFSNVWLEGQAKIIYNGKIVL